MFQVTQDDLLRGLKRFKRLAKQDLLASPMTSNPQFWSAQAEVRRQTYDLLMDWVEQKGVDAAYEEAAKRYAALPLLDSEGQDRPEVRGEEQALEMFFTALGITDETIAEMRSGRVAPSAGDRLAMNASS